MLPWFGSVTYGAATFYYYLGLPLELRLLLPQHNLPLGLEDFLQSFCLEVLNGAYPAL